MTSTIRNAFVPFALLLSACASVKPSPVDPFVNVGTTATQVKRDARAARASVQGLFAADELRAAERAAETALMKRNRAERRDEILRQLGLAEAHLDRAARRTAELEPEHADLLLARARALRAGGDRDPEFARLDERVRKGRLTEAERERAANGYRTLEVLAVVAKHLGAARLRIADALARDARKVSPAALGAAETAFDRAVFAIAKTPRDAAAFRDHVAVANRVSLALEAITAQAHRIAQRPDEDVARELLLERQRRQQLESELAGVELNATVAQRRLRAATEENQVNAALEAARRGLSGEDADVYREGDQLLIELKSGRQPTLERVKGVLRELDARDVMVSGGSDERAAAVARTLSDVTEVSRAVDPNAPPNQPLAVKITPGKVLR